MGLRVVDTKRDTLRLRGHLRCGDATVARGTPKSGRCNWRIEVRHADIPETLSMRSERASNLGRLFEKMDVRVGDSVFDELVRVVGNEADVLAVMAEKTRRKVASWIERGAKVDDGLISWEGEASPQSLDILSRARGLGTLAASLRLDRADVPRRLEENALCDNALGVRVRSLHILVQLDQPLDRHAILVVRVLEEGLDAAEEELRESAEALLETLLERTDDMVLRLGEAGLIAALHHRDARLAAIERLGEIGTERCVSAIVEVTTGLFVGSDLRAAGKEAIARIVARVGDLIGGGLSVVPLPEAGQLSVASTEGGLSRADEDHGD